MREPQSVELAKGKFRAFFVPYSLSMGVIRPIGGIGLIGLMGLIWGMEFLGVIKMTIK